MIEPAEIVKRAFDIGQIRADFPILSTSMNGKPLVFLDSAASSQKPLAVIDAMNEYYKTGHANVHRGVYQLSQKATDQFEQSRRTVQNFLNAKHDHEIIFVRGTTEGINLVASSYGEKFVHAGDEIIVSGLEHHSNIVPWQMLCERKNATLKVIPVLDNGELDMDIYAQLLNEKVKIVAVNHISNAIGTINPVEKIIGLAHEHGIPVLIDGAQATPHMEVDVQTLDADFYVFSGHKVFGPTGIGILYGKEKWLNAMPPYQGGGEMISRVSFEKTTFNELPFKFEAGTPDIAGVVGLGAAIEYLQGMDMDAVREYEHQLLRYATEQLSTIEGIRFIGTASEKASVVSFLIDGLHPYDLGAILDKLGIAVRTGHHCAQPLMDRFGIPGTVRASMAFYNTFEEIDALVNGVKKAIDLLK
jgi:cysteine desulfurase/selenocysteine lyase